MKNLFIMIISILFITTSLAETEDSIFVIISGDTVHIWNTAAHENCGCLFNMDVMVSNDTMYVTEADTATDWAFCMCYFDLCVSVTGLQSGTYYVNVFRYMPLFYPDTVFYIGSTSFNYGGSVLAFFSQSYQSDCYSITEDRGEKEYPADFILEQNYPNPFNPVTTIVYGLKARTNVELKLFDVLGREIVTIVNGEQDAGYYEIEFNASNLPTGIYFYKIKAVDHLSSSGKVFIDTKKMILLK